MSSHVVFRHMSSSGASSCVERMLRIWLKNVGSHASLKMKSAARVGVQRVFLTYMTRKWKSTKISLRSTKVCYLNLMMIDWLLIRWPVNKTYLIFWTKSLESLISRQKKQRKKKRRRKLRQLNFHSLKKSKDKVSQPESPSKLCTHNLCQMPI